MVTWSESSLPDASRRSAASDVSHLSEVVADADVIDVWPLADVTSIEEIEIGEGAEVGCVERLGELRSHGVGAVATCRSRVAGLVEVAGHDQRSSLVDQCRPFARLPFDLGGVDFPVLRRATIEVLAVAVIGDDRPVHDDLAERRVDDRGGAPSPHAWRGIEESDRPVRPDADLAMLLRLRCPVGRTHPRIPVRVTGRQAFRSGPRCRQRTTAFDEAVVQRAQDSWCTRRSRSRFEASGWAVVRCHRGSCPRRVRSSHVLSQPPRRQSSGNTAIASASSPDNPSSSVIQMWVHPSG